VPHSGPAFLRYVPKLNSYYRDPTPREVSVGIVMNGRPTLENSSPRWIRSSLSYANGQCVEVADLASGIIGMRDSKNSGGPILRFTSTEWHAFLAGIRNGDFG